MLQSEERFCAGLQASFFLLCLALVILFTPPPTGEGLAIIFFEFVESALLVYNRLTLLQRGGFGGSVVSFSLLGFQNRTQAFTKSSLLFLL